VGVEIYGIPEPRNVIAWGVEEDITPIDPGSMNGGAGSISLTTVDWPTSRLIEGTDIVLKDSDYGTTIGTAQDVDGDGATVSIIANSELANFNAQRTTGPYSGSLSGLFQKLMDLSNVYSLLDFQAQDRTVHVPGFVGNVWDEVKSLCAAYRVELALVADRIVVRPIRSRTITLPNETAYSFRTNRQTASLAVDVAFYNYRPINRGEVFPVPGEDPPIHSVEAGEISEYELSVNASLSDVRQPVAMMSVGPGDRSGTNGAYSVVGNDNLPITPAQWRAAGGNVEVLLTDEPGRLLLRITGAQIDHLSPFRIAESAGGTDFNSLHITGTGVAWEQEGVRLFTGANPLKVTSELAPPVDNPYITSREQAMVTGAHAAAAHSGGQASVQAATNKIRGLDQTFGNVVGSRIERDGAMYRIESMSAGPEGLSVDGSMDTTVADFNNLGLTTEEFNTLWQDADAKSFSLMPLRRPETDIVEEDTYGSGIYGRGEYGDGG